MTSGWTVQRWALPEDVGERYEDVRELMIAVHRPVAEIADVMGERFGMRPREAWRRALGWSQWQLAQEYNRCYPGAGMTSARVGARERWPFTGRPLNLDWYVTRLAPVYGHGCRAVDLADEHDLKQLRVAARRVSRYGSRETVSRDPLSRCAAE